MIVIYNNMEVILPQNRAWSLFYNSMRLPAWSYWLLSLWIGLSVEHPVVCQKRSRRPQNHLAWMMWVVACCCCWASLLVCWSGNVQMSSPSTGRFYGMPYPVPAHREWQTFRNTRSMWMVDAREPHVSLFSPDQESSNRKKDHWNTGIRETRNHEICVYYILCWI